MTKASTAAGASVTRQPAAVRSRAIASDSAWFSLQPRVRRATRRMGPGARSSLTALTGRRLARSSHRSYPIEGVCHPGPAQGPPALATQSPSPAADGLPAAGEPADGAANAALAVDEGPSAV